MMMRMKAIIVWMMGLKMAKIGTVSGKLIDTKKFKAEDIDILDIAISLSRQRRYVGHTLVPWTVGQHMIFCGMMCHQTEEYKKYEKAVLCHDLHEYIMQDMASPLIKEYTTKVYKKDCDRIDKVLFEHFGIDVDDLTIDVIKYFDSLAYRFECEVFRPDTPCVIPKGVEIMYTKMVTEGWCIPEELINMSDSEVAQVISQALEVYIVEKQKGEIPLKAKLIV